MTAMPSDVAVQVHAEPPPAQPSSFEQLQSPLTTRKVSPLDRPHVETVYVRPCTTAKVYLWWQTAPLPPSVPEPERPD